MLRRGHRPAENELDLAGKILARTRQLFQQRSVEQNQLDKDQSAEQTAKAQVSERVTRRGPRDERTRALQSFTWSAVKNFAEREVTLLSATIVGVSRNPATRKPSRFSQMCCSGSIRSGGVSDPALQFLRPRRASGTPLPVRASTIQCAMFSPGWRKRSVRLTLTRLGFADIDPMFEAFRAVVRLGFHHVHTETRAGQGHAERFFVRRRPESDATAWLQSVCDTIESAPAVDLRVPRLHKRSGSVIDIEKNGVIPRPSRAPDDSKNILGENFHPAVVQQSAVYLHQELPIPLDHLRQQFRDVHLRLFSHDRQHRLQRESESQSADQNAGWWDAGSSSHTRASPAEFPMSSR